LKARTCIVTNESGSEETLIRFVADPDANVVPDLRRRLPGRGVWVTGSRDVVDRARRTGRFAKGFRAAVTVAPDLADQVDGLLERGLLGALSMARKAGDLVTGFTKVEKAIGAGRAAMLIHASDAAEDGIRRLSAMLLRHTDKENSLPGLRIFDSAQLDLAFGGSNVVHAALLGGSTTGSVRQWVDRLERYRGTVSAQMNVNQTHLRHQDDARNHHPQD